MTQILKIQSGDTDPAAFRIVSELLHADGLIVYPTESYYALGGNPFSARVVRRVFEIKERQGDKPLLVLISKRPELDRLVRDLSQEAELLIGRFWPGPLTVLFPAHPDLPWELTSGSGKVGVRFPDMELLTRLIQVAQMPLIGTSANLSGRPSIQKPEEVIEIFTGKVDGILDAGPTAGGLSSTVVDCTVTPPLLIREGRIPAGQLVEVLGGREKGDIVLGTSY